VESGRCGAVVASCSSLRYLLFTKTMWATLIALSIAAIFGFNIWKGWKTSEVRLPISILIYEEFERTKSPTNYWGVMAFNSMVALVASAVAIWSLWSMVSYAEAPVRFLTTLNGCYEGQGMPDIMRPPHHWTMRIADGSVMGREGTTIARAILQNSKGTRTQVRFTPGILIGGKPSTVLAGDTVIGDAYSVNGLVTIALHDDWPNIMIATSCQ
jgi:hypothetical protein